MKIAYLDCFSGISGDMFLGALVDLGLDINELKQELMQGGLEGFDITSRRLSRRSITGTKVDVSVIGDQPHRHLKDILQIIDHSQLHPTIQQSARQIFNTLALAEGKIHCCPPDKVHFHEVGAVDSIVDIVGTLIGLHKLGIEKIYCSPLNVGSGTVRCAHGIMPVPAPATTELLIGVPIYTTGLPMELVTPTGAVLAKCLAVGFGPMPPMILESVGYGVGQRDNEVPNLLRILVGEQNKHLSYNYNHEHEHRHNHAHEHNHDHHHG